jgi:hypothetical protein
MHYVKALPLPSPATIATYQVGQWFQRPNGTLVQFIGMRATPNGFTAPHLSDLRPGESFADRTQRFARARWHLAHKHGSLTTIIKRAPVSVSDADLGRHLRNLVA